MLTDAGKFVDDALLWIITDKIASAVLVLDQHCRLVRANTAGYELLKSQDILRSQGDGISCANSGETAQFRKTVRECADSSAPNGLEKILMLENKATQSLSLLSLRKFECGPAATMVIAMLPAPPDSKRIMMLAREMGLTKAEARIASLMQMGLSNREMAVKAKLTEQTCSTYSKRVLSKLNVNCRAEMAQRLTWQAG
ncbi:helix-turn-helix domain-containing protein [Neptunicoccus sediminis]|uniref:helix-turn-helix domain-containing protein n=1 Tax=Neptunicoccus sediminis TaxID=1892596 RepID=UPI0012FF899D|nr:helix-turn-helix transcriptional regulator [Neptunicoccus sediminis]